MNAAAKKYVTSLKDEGLVKKTGIAILLMAIIPLLLTLYVLHLIAFPGLTGQTVHVRFLGFELVGDAVMIIQRFVIWMICFIFLGILVIRHSITMILKVAKDARAIADGDLSRRMAISESDEISELAKAFNRITQELEKKVYDLEASKRLIQKLLSKVGMAMTSYEGIDSIFELVIETIVSAVEAQSGSLFVIDQEHNDLSCKSYVGERNGKYNERIPLGEGVAGLVAKEGIPIRVAALDRHQSSDSSPGGAAALMCVPLYSHGAIVGALQVSDRLGGGDFSEDDMVLLSNVASQMSVALENYRLNTDIERTYVETITALAMAVEAKDVYSLGHSKRVGEYVQKLADQMNLDDATKMVLRDGAILHDIGKIGIKDDILLKKDTLTDAEYILMKEHSVIGEAILRPVHSLSKVADLVRHHQEHFDGSGYPDGLKGEEIPLTARIMLVCDAFDAMTTDRPYRRKMTIEEAKEELFNQSGKQFDPAIVTMFLKIL